MNEKGARSPDRIKAPNHPARTVRKPPKPETRGSNPRGPASTLQMRARLFRKWLKTVLSLFLII